MQTEVQQDYIYESPPYRSQKQLKQILFQEALYDALEEKICQLQLSL